MDSLLAHTKGKTAYVVLLTWMVLTSLALPQDGQSLSMDERRRAAIEESLQHLDTIPEETVGPAITRIEKMGYTAQRLFRALCRLQDADAVGLSQLLSYAENSNIRYGHIPLVELYCDSPGGSFSGTDTLIHHLGQADFTAGQTLADLAKIHPDKADDLLAITEHAVQLHEHALWALQSLFSVPEITSTAVLQAAGVLTSLSTEQCRAAEKILALGGMNPDMALTTLTRLHQFGNRDAINLRGLASLAEMRADHLVYWLNTFFSLSGSGREDAYSQLKTDKKTLLLHAFRESSRELIWQVNNLHDVTDTLGREIGASRLAGSTPEQLEAIFDRLHPVSRQRYHSLFMTALRENNRQEAIVQLRNATGHARRQTASDLSAANIYTLLANGSELYDSSFRDILTPVLKKRITARYHDRFLDFLVDVDPQHLFISDFITHLAHKGRLTLFFPADPEHQKNILELVADSALGSSESLILFSASFSRLLQELQPEARTYLVHLLQNSITKGHTRMADRLQVILQYYLENYRELLTPENIKEIQGIVSTRGRIDTSRHTRVPFAEWLADHRLAGLSVFQRDDDGRSSYRTFCSSLRRAGYKASVSELFSSIPLNEKIRKQIRAALADANSPEGSFQVLFRLAESFPLAINWQKRVNTIDIQQTVYVYRDTNDQKRLMKLFLESGYEMFAQRGHSYWRHEQIFEPLESLRQSDPQTVEMLDEKQRFVSLGSCGGMRAYTGLNELFLNNVDILASIGTGKAAVNNPYNRKFFELIASNPSITSWKEVARQLRPIFTDAGAEDYIQPGTLPAILHRMTDHLSNGNNSQVPHL